MISVSDRRGNVLGKEETAGYFKLKMALHFIQLVLCTPEFVYFSRET